MRPHSFHHNLMSTWFRKAGVCVCVHRPWHVQLRSKATLRVAAVSSGTYYEAVIYSMSGTFSKAFPKDSSAHWPCPCTRLPTSGCFKLGGIGTTRPYHDCAYPISKQTSDWLRVFSMARHAGYVVNLAICIDRINSTRTARMHPAGDASRREQQHGLTTARLIANGARCT